MVERMNWRVVRFTGLEGGPAYTDLGQIAAILDTAEPFVEKGEAPRLAVARGATIVLVSGVRYYVRETADVAFDEWHRWRTELEPPPKPMKMSASAPSVVIGGEPAEEPGPRTHDG
jgi:hypothetical protein